MIFESVIIFTSIQTILFIIILGILITRLFEKDILYKLEIIYLIVISFSWIVFRIINAYTILSGNFNIVIMIISIISLSIMAIGAWIINSKLSNIMNKCMIKITTLAIGAVILFGILSIKRTSLDFYYPMLIASLIFTLFAYFGIIDFIINIQKKKKGEEEKKRRKKKRFMTMLILITLIMALISFLILTENIPKISNKDFNRSNNKEIQNINLEAIETEIIEFLDLMQYENEKSLKNRTWKDSAE